MGILKSVAFILACAIATPALALGTMLGAPQADIRSNPPAIVQPTPETLSLTSTSNSVTWPLNNAQGVTGVSSTGIASSGATVTIEVEHGNGVWSAKPCNQVEQSAWVSADITAECTTNTGDIAIGAFVTSTGTGSASIYFSAASVSGKDTNARAAGALPTGTTLDTGGTDLLGVLGSILDAVRNLPAAVYQTLSGGITAENVVPYDINGIANDSTKPPLAPNTAACTGVINIAQATTTDLYTSTNKINICDIVIVSNGTQNIGIGEGTGTLCATGFHGLAGMSSTTPELPVTQYTGFVAVSGIPHFETQTAADHLCLFQSSTGELAGYITYTDHT